MIKSAADETCRRTCEHGGAQYGGQRPDNKTVRLVAELDFVAVYAVPSSPQPSAR